MVSQEELDRLISTRDAKDVACKEAAAEVARIEASVEAAKAELAKTVLRAPFDAVIAEASVEVGEWITPSPPGIPIPTILDLIDTAPRFVSAPMDEMDAARISTGQRVDVTVDSHPDRTFPGRVRRVAPYVLDVEEQNRTIEIEVDLDDAELARTLLPGTSADVEVILAERPGTLRIPAHALMLGQRVLVLEGDVLAERRVKIGLKNWEYAEVLEGLSAGDTVVTSLDEKEVTAGARAVVAAEPAAP
jgi:HlyD family secretion protein